MKKDEIRVGLWFKEVEGLFQRVISIHDAEGLVTYKSNHDVPNACEIDDFVKWYRIADPAELSAAGVDDSQRLAEQRDVPSVVDINLVPARIRDEVRKLRTPPPSSAKETRTGDWRDEAREIIKQIHDNGKDETLQSLREFVEYYKPKSASSSPAATAKCPKCRGYKLYGGEPCDDCKGDGVVELPAATRTASRPWTWHEGPNEGVARNRVTKEFVRWRRDIDVLDSFLVCNTSCSQTGNSIARDFMSAKELHEHFEQLNGTPCGVALSASGSGEVGNA